MKAFGAVLLALMMTLVMAPTTATATDAKLDADTCNQLRLEQIAFVQSGVAADVAKGPEWGKANLQADRLRDVERYIALDEQIKFACRDVKLTIDAERAGEAGRKIELRIEPDPALQGRSETPPEDSDDDSSDAAPAGLSPAPAVEAAKPDAGDTEPARPAHKPALSKPKSKDGPKSAQQPQPGSVPATP